MLKLCYAVAIGMHLSSSREMVVWAGRRLTRMKTVGRLVADVNIDLTKPVPEVHLVEINRERQG